MSLELTTTRNFTPILLLRNNILSIQEREMTTRDFYRAFPPGQNGIRIPGYSLVTRGRAINRAIGSNNARRMPAPALNPVHTIADDEDAEVCQLIL